jgi:CheY-like chemotaxis protein
MASILIVHDDPSFIHTAEALLSAQGHRVLSAADGAQALALMQFDRPDLVVLDVRTSYVVGGLDVTEAMGREAALKDIPIMMVSSLPAQGEADTPRRSKCLTPEERAAQPLNPEVMLQRVSDFLS